MKLFTRLEKMFIGGCWTLAYRTIDKNETILTANTIQHEYKVLIPSKKLWYADPFPYQINNRTFVFCEIYDEYKKKGSIGVTEIKDGEMGIPYIIIEQNYHMSYPCMFDYNGVYYMIPETSENNTIELYRAIDFPNGWILDTILVDNVYSVDTTLFRKEDEFYLVTYECIQKEHYLKIYKLNLSTKKVELQITNALLEDVGRPAGNIFEYKDKIIRPSQDGRVKYGEKIILNEIMEWETGKFKEKQVGVFSINNIILKNYRKVKRVHTINRTSSIEVIDIRTEIIDPFLVIKRFKRKMKTIYRFRTLT